jgi:hypothetical protein
VSRLALGSKQPPAHWVKLKLKVKVKVTVEEATKAQRGSRGLALFFL